MNSPRATSPSLLGVETIVEFQDRLGTGGTRAETAQSAGLLDSTLDSLRVVPEPSPCVEGGNGSFLRDAGKVQVTPRVPCSVGPGFEAEPDLFDRMAKASSVAECGIHLAWGLGTGLISFDGPSAEPSRAAGRTRSGGLFPLPVNLPSEARTRLVPLAASTRFDFAVECWLGVTCAAINRLYGCRRAVTARRPGKVHRAALGALEGKIRRFLEGEPSTYPFKFSEVIGEIKERKISYTGEEIAQPFPLSRNQIEKSLPPVGHGGSVPLLPFVKGRTRFLLENPLEILVPPEDRDSIPCQARVHIKKGEELSVFALLHQRGVIEWVPDSTPFETSKGPVLNGIFGVVKAGKFTSDSLPVLRVIMNLIPANNLLRVISGDIGCLPHATSWLPLVIDNGVEIHMSQGDMASAFYLFALPSCWRPFMCFNFKVAGELIWGQRGVSYHPCCIVLPMGWSSSVGIMQQVSREILLSRGLPSSLELRKGLALPPWFTQAMDSASTTTAWWQVYLDNFFSGERTGEPQGQLNSWLQAAAMQAWGGAGILTAADKQVLDTTSAVELGVRLDGKSGLLGVSPERLLRTIWASVHLLTRPRWEKKLAQIVLGRWVFVLQFRRAAMGALSRAWETIESPWPNPSQLRRFKEEVLMLMCMSPLLQADLACSYDPSVTCSDASDTGGAAAVACQLSKSGASLTNFWADQRLQPVARPILLISIFNGIGGAFRIYDVLGVSVMGRISIDISRPANRVTRSTWPGVLEFHDITSLTLDDVRAWADAFPRVEEVHIFAGFPCVHLSSARAYRKNLSGEGSNLFWHLLTLLQWIHTIFGSFCTVKHCIENVASMDEDARKQISAELDIVPVKLDPADSQPFSRPRFAWCSEELFAMEGLQLVTEKEYVRAYVSTPTPAVGDWIRPGWRWEPTNPSSKFPTFMKSIVRTKPPPVPAGRSRASASALAMWEAHAFRFPPYQYAEDHRLRHAQAPERLLDSSEREILMGFGAQHTATCMSASEAKKSYQAFEDTRLSLIGDSFAILSFAVVAAQMCAQQVPRMSPKQIFLRLGLAPGASAHPQVCVPMARWLQYGGSAEACDGGPLQLVQQLGLTVNHTGADVRITSGHVLGSKNPGHASVRALWWQWKHLFKVRWVSHVHINFQEMKMVLHSLLWKARDPCAVNKRWLHLEDSMVCLYILSKGRTSSHLLQPLANKIGALQLGLGVTVMHAHVPSAENPHRWG